MTEAPPPCEVCFPYMEPRMDVVPAVIRARYTGDLVIHAQRLHHEIAELRALLAEYIDWHDYEPGVDTPDEGNEPYWLERARAALRALEKWP